jgi:proteic killer suppression protein
MKTNELEQLYVTPLNEIRGKQKFSRDVIKQYQAKVRILTIINNLKDLYPIRSLNFEALAGNRKRQFSIRLNKQYRLIIIEAEDELIEIEIIEISKHYE